MKNCPSGTCYKYTDTGKPEGKYVNSLVKERTTQICYHKLIHCFHDKHRIHERKCNRNFCDSMKNHQFMAGR